MGCFVGWDAIPAFQPLMLGLHPSLRSIPACVIPKDFKLTDYQTIRNIIGRIKEFFNQTQQN